MGVQRSPAGQADGVIAQARLDDGHFVVDLFDPVGSRVFGEFHGQFGAAHVDETRIVFDFLGQENLAAGHAFFDQHRFKGRPHGVYRGRESAGAAAHDDNVVHLILFHGSPHRFYSLRSFKA